MANFPSNFFKFSTIFLNLFIGFTNQVGEFQDNSSSLIVERTQDESLYPVILGKFRREKLSTSNLLSQITIDLRIKILLDNLLLVPGYMGSRLFVQTDSTAQLPIFCGRLPRTWNLWLSIRSFIPLVNQCWLYGARLQYDPKTHKTHNSRGVWVIVPNFGGLDAVENLLPWIPHQFSPGRFGQFISSILLSYTKCFFFISTLDP